MLTLTCKRAAALVSASLERALPLGEFLLLRLHLRVCAACARYKEQLELLRGALRRHARQLEERCESRVPALAPDARARLKQSLRRPSSSATDGTEDGGPLSGGGRV